MCTPLRAAVVQLSSSLDLEANLRTAADLTRRAADLGAEVVLLPENFPLIGSLDRKVAIAEALPPAKPGPILARMTALARDLGIPIVLGSIPTKASRPDRFRNTTVVLDDQGKITEIYNKIHLFDVSIPDGPSFQESTRVEPGDRVVTTDVRGVRLGLSICYDLRFPELYRKLAAQGAEILLVPAAFLLDTGKDHWLPLLRARAIENQAYVLAANQTGAHTPRRSSYGKSCIIDPWGTVIAQVSDGPGVAVAEIDLAYLREVRQRLPALDHRRL